jgi:hypothetical protein
MLALVLVLAGVAATIPSSASSDSSTPFRSALVVHLIRRCSPHVHCLPPHVLQAMRDEAEHIWSSLGVQIAWIDSIDPESSAHKTVGLRVMLEERGERAGARSSVGRVVLGAMSQPHDPCGLGLARLWVAHARRHVSLIRFNSVIPIENLPNRLADRVLARALGRALAHEIGHYLLGTTHHTSRGLMRERFTPDELLESATKARYGLDRPEREALQPCRLNRAHLR